MSNQLRLKTLLVGGAGLLFVSLSAPFPANAANASFPRGLVAINFDDGKRNIYTNAIPILNRAGLKSTFYIVTNYADGTHQPNMRWPEIMAVHRQGHEIGAHTRTHRNLKKLNQEQRIAEIRGSRKDLERHDITNVQTFAYPYGIYTGRLMKLVREEGFSGARVADGQVNSKTTHPYALHSFSITRKMSLKEITGVINKAVRQKKWLILTIHDVTAKPKLYGTTPKIFRGIVAHLKKNNIRVVTNAEGVEIMRATQ
ncbi:MAG: polysaccharide deacetylase family protein [Candidatus Kerfeldbacteria bacterium]|nr:polysaccharide deacetylase family protein [Candidatus Kerfeldbacteria bacterium]